MDERQDDYLQHYGVVGMKWGVRNAETQRKYAGGKGRKKSSSAKKVSASSAVKSRISSGAARVKGSVADKIDQAKAERARREETGLSRKDYNKLRTKTLRSNDPAEVVKGMSTLTDKELSTKLDRLTLEKQLRDLSADVTIKESSAAKAKEEALRATKERRNSGFAAKSLTTVVNTVAGVGKAYVLNRLGLVDGDKTSSKDDAKTGSNETSADNKKSTGTNKSGSSAGSGAKSGKTGGSYGSSTGSGAKSGKTGGSYGSSAPKINLALPSNTLATVVPRVDVGRSVAENMGIIDVEPIDSSSYRQDQKKKK